jgi:hypothetical protein
VRQRENDDVVADDLIREREREAIEQDDAPIVSMFPLRSRQGEPADQRDRGIDLVFELLAEAGCRDS